jgi:excisionase family DNA binding protein
MHALELPTEDTARAAGEAVRAFSSRKHPPSHVEVVADGDRPTRVELPVEALDLLLEVLTHLSNGHGVTIMPVRAELTTQQAADMLNVSRPYVIKLLDEGHLPFRKVGTHRRVRLEDLLAYKRIDDARRREAADALAAEAQALGLGY